MALYFVFAVFENIPLVLEEPNVLVDDPKKLILSR